MRSLVEQNNLLTTFLLLKHKQHNCVAKCLEVVSLTRQTTTLHSPLVPSVPYPGLPARPTKLPNSCTLSLLPLRSRLGISIVSKGRFTPSERVDVANTKCTIRS